jgi:CheY-like chemotaxis protein
MVIEKTFHVFVVDDERVISDTLAAILRLNGFAATSFTNPLDALDSAHSASPDLLLSDVAMPQLSGIELAIQIREKCPNCKICYFPDRRQRVICYRMLESGDMSSSW